MVYPRFILILAFRCNNSHSVKQFVRILYLSCVCHANNAAIFICNSFRSCNQYVFFCLAYSVARTFWPQNYLLTILACFFSRNNQVFSWIRVTKQAKPWHGWIEHVFYTGLKELAITEWNSRTSIKKYKEKTYQHLVEESLHRFLDFSFGLRDLFMTIYNNQMIIDK